MGVSHLVVKKGVYSGRMGIFWEGRISKGGGGIFWVGGVDSGNMHTVVEKGGIFWKDGVDSGSRTCYKKGYILEGRGG